MTIKFPHLFTPLKMNSVMLMNRILTSPMGVPNAKIISSTNYGGVSIMDRSRGGASVVTVNYQALTGAAEFGYVDLNESVKRDPFSKYSRDPSREIISVLKQAGALSNIQIFFHPRDREDGTSQMPCDCIDYRGRAAKAMTEEEIQDQINLLVKRAVDAKNFGFDIVMLHFAHDSLTSLFLSPVWNQRSDKYGGSLDNRCRITIEAAKAVREAVGPNYPLMMRISRNLWVKESYSEDDMAYLIRQLEPYIDMVNVSVSMDCYGGTIDKYDANVHMSTINFEPHMYNIDFCARLKKETSMLICPIGAVMTPEEAEEAIANNKCDAVMLGRAMVADPFWPRKAMEGRSEDIVPCLRCGHCYHISTEHYNVVCSVNPRFRRENRVPLKLDKADVKKRVVVIGGGPAGCKAALTAAERGHEVILLEKEDKLGGQINVSDYDDYKQDLRRYRNYLVCQINKSPVEVRLNTCATKELVTSLKPDALIVCIGAEAVNPKIQGIENAIPALEAYPHLDELKGKIVVVGGGTIGSEMALEFADRGNEVTVVETSDTLASKGNWLYRLALNQHINKHDNLHKMMNSFVTEIKDNEVMVKNSVGQIEKVAADHVIIAVGMKPKREEAYSFYGICPQTYTVGDCYNVAKVIEATNDAYFIAANL